MAKSLLTDYFSLHNAKQFIESISETANSIYYVFAGRHLPNYKPDYVNYANSLSSYSNSAYVSELYRYYLQREPDVGGQKYWTGIIDGGIGTRADVEDVFQRGETRSTTVNYFSEEFIPNANNDNNSVNINVYKDMVFGKKLANSDVKIMVPRYNWTSNTVYTPYRGNTDLTACSFYTVVNAVSSFHVFKCLDNDGGAPSTVPPNFNDTGADDEFYSTSDGYVWKYMYTIDKTTFEKFATEDYIPVVPNANVTGNAVAGAIDVIVVDSPGSNYNVYLSNTFISTDIAVGGDPTKFNIANNAYPANGFYQGCVIYIKEGTGYGQLRKIVDYTVTNTQKLIDVEPAFTITPDSTSVYEITPSVLITGDGNNAIARAIVNVAFVTISSPYANLAGTQTSLSNSAYVTKLYNYYFQRDPDTGGLNFWTNVISTSTGTRAQVEDVFLKGETTSTSANGISKVEIIQRGSGYTYATAQVIGNTSGVSNAAVLSIVLGPKGGHGKNSEYELGGKFLGISTTFANNESNTIPTQNDYRMVGIIKDPYFANVVLSVTSSTGIFTDNETVTQTTSGATGIVTDSTGSTVSVTNVTGIFVTSQIITGSSSGATANVTSYVINGQTKNFNTFDNRFRYTYSGGSGTFVQDETAYQLEASVANAVYHSNDSNYYYLTNIKGIINTGNTLVGVNSGASVNLLTRLPPDIVEGSGEVLYIENTDPISRDVNQSETVKLILKF